MGQPQQYGEMVPYQAPAYSVQPFMQPMHSVPPAQKTNGLAVASLVLALAGLIFTWIAPLLFQLLALIFGLIAKSQIKSRGGAGGGMATAGIIISAIVMGLSVIGLIAVIALYGSLFAIFGAAGAAGS